MLHGVSVLDGQVWQLVQNGVERSRVFRAWQLVFVLLFVASCAEVFPRQPQQVPVSCMGRGWQARMREGWRRRVMPGVASAGRQG